MHLSVISNPTSPPDQLSSELEPMSTSEDEDLANNNECSTADTAAEHSSLSASSSTTDSDLSSNLNFGYFENGNLNDLSSADTEEAEELIRKAAQALLDRTPLRARQLAQSRSLHSIRTHAPAHLPQSAADYNLQYSLSGRSKTLVRGAHFPSSINKKRFALESHQVSLCSSRLIHDVHLQFFLAFPSMALPLH
ncbi:hypothetical protein BIW11_01046 [Tropilaelaps mercedesae]|uniref:Uncharacterized protein n=1 Tax=Tropilaelaps mercedesae TaxID=418985 RepID=A0A1V9XKN8_9ACAR|nr:hypothetical protein BIW11_01046 [Tropilaelaps mercedesae]